jgi:hypothetical protein
MQGSGDLSPVTNFRHRSWTYFDFGGEVEMATIDQPKPSEPKSPQQQQRPLQPGQTDSGSPDDATPSRPNFQTPDSQKDKIRRD